MTPRMPTLISTISDMEDTEHFISLMNKYESLLTANGRKALLENGNVKPEIVMMYAFRENLDEGRILYLFCCRVEWDPGRVSQKTTSQGLSSDLSPPPPFKRISPLIFREAENFFSIFLKNTFFFPMLLQNWRKRQNST